MMLGSVAIPFAGAVGHAALIFTLATAVAVMAAAGVYLLARRKELIQFIEAGTGLIATCLTVGSLAMLQALLTDNFALDGVARHSEKSMGVMYKIAAFWAGQEGSLLLWAWVLGIMGALMAWRLRKEDGALAAVTLATMAAVTGFFAALMLGVADPFKTAEQLVEDGSGLNPALQNLAMVFHPPLLFLGYAGYTAPLAYMLGGLLTGSGRTKHEDTKGTKSTKVSRKEGTASNVLDYATARMIAQGPVAEWLVLARPWMVYSWIMMTVGIVLGAWWAYVELGWGGYWAWDPVENASLLPWLTGTALLHSTILQVKRGTFKWWVAGLTAASFLLCILGTYLTRSGVIQSVHAFEESPIGWFFLGFMGVVIAVSVAAMVLGRAELRGERALEALVSREGFFLIGNVLLAIMTATVIVGTMFPLISPLFLATPVTLKEPFYNQVILPMGLVLAALMATGPVLGTGGEAFDKARMKLGGMMLAGVAAAGVLLALEYQDLWALATAVVCGAVVAGVVIDLYGAVRGTKHEDTKHTKDTKNSEVKGTPDRARSGSVGGAIVVRRRHWGAVLAHLGLAAFVAGVAGSGLYGATKTMHLHPGDGASTKERREIRGYVMELKDFKKERRDNHSALVAVIGVTGANGRTFTLSPERRIYDKSPDRPAAEVSLRPTPLSDVYVTLEDWEDGGAAVTITAKVNPLVSWLWIGTGLMVVGGGLCMTARRRMEKKNDQ